MTIRPTILAAILVVQVVAAEATTIYYRTSGLSTNWDGTVEAASLSALAFNETAMPSAITNTNLSQTLTGLNYGVFWGGVNGGAYWYSGLLDSYFRLDSGPGASPLGNVVSPTTTWNDVLGTTYNIASASWYYTPTSTSIAGSGGGTIRFSATPFNSSVPEIDPSGLGSVAAIVTATLGLIERRRRRFGVAIECNGQR